MQPDETIDGISMNSIDKTVAKRLTIQYVIALSLVAVLTILGHTLIQLILTNTTDSSRVINLAGRQRMLSQQLTKLSVLRQTSPGNWDQSLENTFSESLSEWKSVHVGLRDNLLVDDKRYEVKNTKVIDSLFKAITPSYDGMNAFFEAQKNEKMSEDIGVLLNHESAFLKTMDRIVFEYDLQAAKTIGNIKRIEFVILFLTLLTLFFEFVLIFQPLSNYVKRVITELITSKQKLDDTHSQLSVSNRMLRNIQEDLDKAMKERYELKRKEDQIRSASLLEGQEEERKRISREIHDGLGQMLTGVKLGLSRLKSSDLSEKYQKAYEHTKDLLTETIETTRAVSFNLMPTALNDYGISSALKILITSQSLSGETEIDLDIDEPDKRYDQKLEIAIYRIVQEALNNIIKHANASKAKVSLNENNDVLELSITDNGVGFDTGKLKQSRASLIHNGVENMKTRAELLNGAFKLTTIPGGGTDIFIKLPIKPADK
ncbi:histidine kinase [Jiulongibacter sediminis]|mgnify:CR=1 FL=1|jgi:signal transduction histidine kinase|uniref:ATP-binding protein n=1 Tax=Jiulongibacter sediminis TaxID=1605367 RepID=UPI0026EF48D6|nr:histidine kinase [Jiulongibacter sediminis]